MISENGRPGTSVETRIAAYDRGELHDRYDRLATEEPLEIRLRAGGKQQTVAITMRTPGNDFELAAGFLFNEGVIGSLDEVQGITFCVDRDVDEEQRYNIVNVDLHGNELPPLDALERHFTITSAALPGGTSTTSVVPVTGMSGRATGAQPPSGLTGAPPMA